ncbi:MAG: CRISPR-associated endonuclease Cas1 [Prosthecobacter sp.]|uniref:CRISPR-associated endonuclease Cas1 n=1 Tax=Prosthecobacter sp. TaxID=1965333 RepID=UPI0039039A93
MPNAWIETPGAIIRLRSERLEVTLPADDMTSVTPPPVDLPLAEIERLIVAEDVRLTFPALCEALRRSIPVMVHDWRGDVLGTMIPATTAHAALRLQQYRCAQDATFATVITRALLQAKVRNQRRLLSRLNYTRPNPEVGVILDRIAAILEESDRTSDVAALRGFEGAASALYWPAWAAFLPAEFIFERRSTRPPLNPVNAVLSYLSSILYGETLAACHRRGIDPGLGHLHVTANGRWSLALDLMEPFRPAVLEATALRLFTHRMLGPADFQQRDGGTYLTASGRKTVIEQYDRRTTREFHSEHVAHRTTLRQQIEATVLSYRMALDDAASFRPFIMN